MLISKPITGKWNETITLSLDQGFSALELLTFRARSSFLVGSYSMHYRMSSSIVASTHYTPKVFATYDNQKCLHLDIAKCPLGGTITTGLD